MMSVGEASKSRPPGKGYVNETPAAIGFWMYIYIHNRFRIVYKSICNIHITVYHSLSIY